MDGKTNDALLDELYALTQVEKERKLSREETDRYMKIVQYCQENDVEIDFGITY